MRHKVLKIIFATNKLHRQVLLNGNDFTFSLSKCKEKQTWPYYNSSMYDSWTIVPGHFPQQICTGDYVDLYFTINMVVKIIKTTLTRKQT